MQVDTKTRERTEGAATAVQAMYGDSCSANRVNPDPMCSTSFGGDSTGPPALPCSRDDAQVGNGAAAPKSCLSPLEIRSPTTTGGLLPAGMITTATKTTFHQLPLWFCLTEETNPRTSTIYVPYFSSFGWINNQQASFWPRAIETKSGQNLVFDPGGSIGRLRTCPFLGMWHALRCGENPVWISWWRSPAFFWRINDSGFKNLQERYKRIIYAVRIAVSRFFSVSRLALSMPCQAMRA